MLEMGASPCPHFLKVQTEGALTMEVGSLDIWTYLGSFLQYFVTMMIGRVEATNPVIIFEATIKLAAAGIATVSIHDVSA